MPADDRFRPIAASKTSRYHSPVVMKKDISMFEMVFKRDSVPANPTASEALPPQAGRRSRTLATDRRDLPRRRATAPCLAGAHHRDARRFASWSPAKCRWALTSGIYRGSGGAPEVSSACRQAKFISSAISWSFSRTSSHGYALAASSPGPAKRHAARRESRSARRDTGPGLARGDHGDRSIPAVYPRGSATSRISCSRTPSPSAPANPGRRTGEWLRAGDGSFLPLREYASLNSSG